MARNTKSRRPAEVFPPGRFLREELESREWSQSDLARVLGRPVQAINEIINAKKRITPETSIALAAALDTDPMFWLNLEIAYRVWLAGDPDPKIAQRARKLEHAS